MSCAIWKTKHCQVLFHIVSHLNNDYGNYNNNYNDSIMFAFHSRSMLTNPSEEVIVYPTTYLTRKTNN